MYIEYLNTCFQIKIAVDQSTYTSIRRFSLSKCDHKLSFIADICNVSQSTACLQVPGNVTWGSYRVKVAAEGTLNFRNETFVRGGSRSVAIFIQTDKATYKPGDTGN